MHIHINVVAVIGLMGLMIGLAGEPTFLFGGCILIGSSLVAKAISHRGVG